MKGERYKKGERALLFLLSEKGRGGEMLNYLNYVVFIHYQKTGRFSKNEKTARKA